MPANVLNLPQHQALRVEEAGHVTAELVDVTAWCPHCRSDCLPPWGTRDLHQG